MLFCGGDLYPSSRCVHFITSVISRFGRMGNFVLVDSKVILFLFLVIYSYNLLCMDEGRDIISWLS